MSDRIDASADENLFSGLDVPKIRAANQAVDENDLFAGLTVPDVQHTQVSGLSSFMSGALRGALPAAGGFAAAGAGAELGAAAGAFFGPFGAAAGGVIGGIGGFLGGSTVVHTAQDWTLKQLPDSWQEAIGQSARQQRLQEEQHPIYSFLGGLVPYAITMSPGAFSTKALNLPENATAFQKVMANPMTSRLFGGAAMGGLELGTELATQDQPDWTKVAISTGFGIVWNKPTALGEYLTNAGASPARAALGPVRNAAVGFNMLRSPMDIPPQGVLHPTEPTVAQAADLGVVGPGITESTFMGGQQQSLPTRIAAHNAAADEAAALGPLPTPDLDLIARKMHPELFKARDELIAQRDALRQWIADESNPPETAFDDLASKRAEIEAALQAANPRSPDARNYRAQLRDIDRQQADLIARREAWSAGQHVDSPEMMMVRQHLLDTEHALWDLAPDVSAAMRRAADHAGQIEPEVPAAAPEVAGAPEAAVPTEQPAPAIQPQAPQIPATKSIEQQRADIIADRTEQLVAAGLPRDQAHASASVEAAYYVTLSQRFDGALGTPWDVYQARAPRVQGEGQAVPTGGAPPTPRQAEPTATFNIGEARPGPARAQPEELTAKPQETAAQTPESPREEITPPEATPTPIEPAQADPTALQTDASGKPIIRSAKEYADLSGVSRRRAQELNDRDMIALSDWQAARRTQSVPEPAAQPTGTPAPAAEQPAQRPRIRTTKQIMDEDRVSPAQAAKIQEDEIAALADWQASQRERATAPVEKPPALEVSEEKPVVTQHSDATAGGLEALDPASIGVDAEKFQFKSGTDEAGVSERLQGVEKWDPRLAGTAIVFRDAEGKNWIADGHQRLGLAKRLIEQGQTGIRLNSFVLDAKDGMTPESARRIAAAKNIAEGTGTSIDAAKIIRDAAEKGEELPPLPPRSTLVRDGRALARLSPDAFGMAVNEVIPINQAAVVGRLVDDPLQQVEAIRVLAKAKPDNVRQAELIVRDVRETAQAAVQQGGLFGDEHFASSAVLERAKVADEAMRQLGRDRTTFRTLVDEAERIQGHGENILDVEANRSRLTADEQARQLLTSLATHRGPVSDALTDIARRVKSGDISTAAGAREFLGIVRDHHEGRVAEGTDVGRAEPGAAEGAVAPSEVAVAERPARQRELDVGGNPIFEKGERVVIPEGQPGAGRHGTLVEAYPSHTVRRNGAERSIMRYTVETDGGARFPVDHVAEESGHAPQVRRDPVVGNRAYDPAGLETRIQIGRDNAKRETREARREKDPERKARKLETADHFAREADQEQAVLDAWRREETTPPTDLLGAPERAQAQRATPEPTIRSDERQVGIPGTEPSAHQAQAARDAAGPREGQKPMDEGLFASPETPQPKLFEQTARGKIRLTEDGRAVITLMRDADASTFMHESAHHWLEELLEHAQHPKAPEQLRGDADIIRNWLGAKRDEDITYSGDSRKLRAAAAKRHEKFARGFEQYLREGVAPSPGLARVFAQFKDWLVRIYETIKGLGAPINDDVRGVFDRMLELEPRRTVHTEPSEAAPSIATIHERDAVETEPHEAVHVGDRVVSETNRYIAAQPPEVIDELAAATRPEPGTELGGPAAQPGAETGAGPAGSGPLVQGGGQSGPVAPSGRGGAERGAVAPRSREPVPESPRVSGEREPGRRGTEPSTGAEQFAPRPAETFADKDPDLVDLAGNIRVENLTDQEEIAKAIHDSAARNDDFMSVRGGMSKPQIAELAESMGLDANRIDQQGLTRLFGGTSDLAAKIFAARRLVVQSAEIVSAAMKKAAEGSDADVAALGLAIARHDMIQSTLSGVTAEWGRAGNAFHSLLEGWGKAQDLNQLLRDNLGRDLFQLKQIAKMGATLDTPSKVSKLLRETRERSFGRMILEYWINALISGPTTHTTNMIGNALLSIQKGIPETAAAAAIGRVRQAFGREGERILPGEVGVQMRAAVRELPVAVKAGATAMRAGQSTLLPGETPWALRPFQGDTELVVGGQMTNAPVSWREAMGEVYGIVQGLRDGFVAAGELVKAGGVEGAPLIGTQYSPLGQIPDIAVKGVNVLPIGTMARLPGRALATMDSAFRAANYSMEINALAYRQAMSEGLEGQALAARIADLRQNPPEEMMERARSTASELTLMAHGGKFMQTLQTFFNQSLNLPLLGETPLLKFISPFVRVAGNIFNQAFLQRLPFGVLSAEIRADLMGKNGNVAQDMAMARMAVGTAYAITAGGLAAQGLISGSGPIEPEKQAMWRLAGNQAHSVAIGDIWYDVHRLGPLGILMSVAADLYDVAHSIGRDDADVVGKHLMHAFAQNILDESFMRGPSDLIRAVTDSDRYGSSYVRQFLSSFMPYSVGMGQIARATDPYTRQARTIMDAMKAKVPGLSEELLPKRDIWGEPMPSNDAWIAKGVTAVYLRHMSTDSVNQAMLALGIAPKAVDRKIRGVELSDEQYDEFAKIAGRMTKMRLDAIVQAPQFEQWPNSTKHYVFEETIRANREAARGMMLMKYPELARQAVIHERERKFGEPKPIQ